MKKKRASGSSSGGCACPPEKSIWCGAVTCLACGRALSPAQQEEARVAMQGKDR